jgi:hypothetical protein
MHTQVPSCTHINPIMHTHKSHHAHAQIPSCTQTNSVMHTHTHTCIHMHIHTPPCTCKLALTHTHIHTSLDQNPEGLDLFGLYRECYLKNNSICRHFSTPVRLKVTEYMGLNVVTKHHCRYNNVGRVQYLP